MRLNMNRSPRWAFFSKFVIPNLDNPDETYLTRYRIIQTPWFGIFVHRMDGPDSRATLHDHPWTFTSFVLRGGYIERRWDPLKMEVNEEHRVRWFNRMPLRAAHSIRTLLRYPTWTLVLTGRRVRTWGFLDLNPKLPHSYVWTAWDEHKHTTTDFDRIMEMRERGRRFYTGISEEDLTILRLKVGRGTGQVVSESGPMPWGNPQTETVPGSPGLFKKDQTPRLSEQETDSPALSGGDSDS